MECYFWVIGMYFEPQYSVARKIATKLCSMATMMDDIYDAFGRFEELKIFTEAIDRYTFRNQSCIYLSFIFILLASISPNGK